MSEIKGSWDLTNRNAESALRTKALESLLIEKGLISSDAIDTVVRKFEHEIGPLNGARVVARAWVDCEFRERLLKGGSAAVAELGIPSLGTELVIVENTPDIHNVVVCTLCSCYPWTLLGLPPGWYKSFAYRSRLVREPRAVLLEFDLELPQSVEIRVWDSNSDMRYMVLPMRPAGSESFGEAELSALVTRDSMIGVALAGDSGAVPAR